MKRLESLNSKGTREKCNAKLNRGALRWNEGSIHQNWQNDNCTEGTVWYNSSRSLPPLEQTAEETNLARERPVAER